MKASLFVSGFCAAGALHNAVEGNAWWVLLLTVLSAANFGIALIEERVTR